MINRNISVHLQDFPDVSFLNDEKELVSDMDLIRAVCSTALSIRDNKNLRVRLPLKSLKVIGKDAKRIIPFKDIICDEVNVKEVEVSDDIAARADVKLQVNFKQVGAKYGPKIKEMMAAIKEGTWKKVSDSEVEIAGVNLLDDEFELKLLVKEYDEKKEVINALPSNDYLVCLDVEVTKELEDEGIARDIVRFIQQNRKDADLDVSDKINLKIFAQNDRVAEVLESFSDYIKEQVLGDDLQILSEDEVKKSCKFSYENILDEQKIVVGF